MPRKRPTIRGAGLGGAFGALALLALAPVASGEGPPAPAGPEFQVNTLEGAYPRPSVAMESDGDFVVVWTGYYSSYDPTAIRAQRYDSSGSSIGSEFQVNTYTSDYQDYPSVAVEDDGGFVVVWRSWNQLFSQNEYGIQGQRFDVEANPVGDQFQVSALTAGLGLR